jgi:hypothetical protein
MRNPKVWPLSPVMGGNVSAAGSARRCPLRDIGAKAMATTCDFATPSIDDATPACLRRTILPDWGHLSPA